MQFYLCRALVVRQKRVISDENDESMFYSVRRRRNLIGKRAVFDCRRGVSEAVPSNLQGLELT